jgi:acylphosphatase
MSSKLASLQAVVQGQVQGVYFRAFVHHHATELGLKGYVHNLPNRAVGVWAEGKKGDLLQLLQYLRQGPPGAKVGRVEVNWGDYRGKFTGFNIKY